MHKMSVRAAAVAAVTMSALAVLSGCGLSSAVTPNDAAAKTGGGVLKIGASLPLTGPGAEFGQAAQEGYKTWESEANAHGGILGRKVQLVIRDDATDQNTAVADYNSLLSSDHVDLLLGTFSSFLVGPTSAIAEKAGKLFVTPTGGAPQIFERGFKMTFLTQQATAIGIGDVFAHYIESLPAAERPQTAAYPTMNDPLLTPTVDHIRTQLEALGVKTVYQTTYAQDAQNFDQIASAIKSSGAQLVAQGAGFDDAVGLTRALVKANASPQYLYQVSGPDTGSAYSDAVGAANANGVMFSTTWSAKATTPGNDAFLAAYKKLYGSQVPHEDAADAYVAGQVLQAAVTAVGASGLADQSKLADWLRSNTVTTIIGPLSWNADGSPKGEELLGQWQSNAIEIVRPAGAATTKTIVTTWRAAQ